MKNESNKPGFGLVNWILVVAILLLVSLFFLPRPTPPPASPAASESIESAAAGQPASESSVGKPPEDWGIEVVALYPAVNGRVLDLRYKILDAARAAKLPDQPGTIYLLDPATGEQTKLPNSPKTGSIPQNPQKLEAGRTYSVSFPNPGGRFKSGSKLTLVMGGFRAENLTVQ